VTQPDTRLDVHAFLVGPAMVLRVVHPRQRPAVDLAPTTAIEDSCYSAHRFVP
jgi:hypothetical protein